MLVRTARSSISMVAREEFSDLTKKLLERKHSLFKKRIVIIHFAR
jgi:hypothetical protein